MKVEVTVTVDVPGVDTIDDARKAVRDWLYEADCVLRQHHGNENAIPTNPCVQDVKKAETTMGVLFGFDEL